MTTTDVPENRRAWEKPANYDPQWFELALRNVEAGDHRISWNPVWMPNRKTDTNNNFAISTDFIGQNWDYPEADYATRAKIVQAHVDWQQGLMWTYAHHPRVPEKSAQNSSASDWRRTSLPKTITGRANSTCAKPAAWSANT